jgi:hypothetical protein
VFAEPAGTPLRSRAVRASHATSLAFLLIVPGALASGQTGGRLTEEAQTAPSRTLVLETHFDYIAAEPNFLTGAPRGRFAGPLLRLVYSPAGNVELDLEWVSFVGAPNDPDFRSASDRGDVSLRAKVRFVEGTPSRPTVGARFWVALPETKADVGLGPNELRQGTELLVSQVAGRAALHVNAGFSIADEVFRPHIQRDFFTYGVAATHPVGSRGEVLGEVAGRAGKGVPGADEHAEARLGFRWSQGPVHYDAALRRGLVKADGRWGFTVGLSWTIRPRPKPITAEPVP